ncbi:hypothetical protein Bbelb_258050, partial [Branchiostoma belcheri]
MATGCPEGLSCPDWEKPVMTGDSCLNQMRAKQTSRPHPTKGRNAGKQPPANRLGRRQAVRHGPVGYPLGSRTRAGRVPTETRRRGTREGIEGEGGRERRGKTEGRGKGREKKFVSDYVDDEAAVQHGIIANSGLLSSCPGQAAVQHGFIADTSLLSRHEQMRTTDSSLLSRPGDAEKSGEFVPRKIHGTAVQHGIAACSDSSLLSRPGDAQKHSEDGRHSWTGRIDCRSQRQTTGSLYLNGVDTDRASVLPSSPPSPSLFLSVPSPPRPTVQWVGNRAVAQSI